MTPRQTAENLVFPYGDYLVDPARGLAFAAIPKNGCSDLKHWFISLVEPEKLADPSFRLHAYCREAHMLASHPAANRAELLRSLFTIAFVRDPLSRLVSAYVEKFVHPEPTMLFEPAREVLAHFGFNAARGLTFREFVQFLEALPDEHLESHWRPQSAFVRDVRIDLLAKVEVSTAVLEALGKELGMPPRAGRRINATGYTPPAGEPAADVPSAELHARSVLPPVTDLYDDDLRARVQQRLADDVRLYNSAVTEATPGMFDGLRLRG